MNDLKDREWEIDRGERQVTCHSLVIGGVLCRWWGEDNEKPPGADLLAALVKFRKEYKSE